ncbi:MAG: hypothetical protein ACRDFZ_09335 [Candidatus Limnocylindria bacterium]
MKRSLEVSLEAGGKRVFACALDWPGWCRSGKTDDDALAALVRYGPRYAAAIGPEAGLDPPSSTDDLKVVERLKGAAGTDFGIPSKEAKADRRPVDEADLERMVRVLTGAWAAFDAAAERAAGHELRKGPRGGGRNRDKIVEHVLEAEEAYLRMIGGTGRGAPKAGRGKGSPMASIRDRALEALADRVNGVPLSENPRRRAKPWTPRYFARRSAWHALDHAWEIEDRVEP